MKTEITYQEWINRYVSEISQYLPKGKREDILTEIRSTLMDEIEENIHSRENEEIEEEEIALNALRQMGSPRQIAEQYLPSRGLIGPQLYPPFLLLLKILLSVVFTVYLITYFFTVSQSGFSFEQLLSHFTNLLSTALQSFGNLVLIFAILERVLPINANWAGKKDWDPSTLPPAENKIPLQKPLIQIGITLVWIILFNLYSNQVGIYNFREGYWSFTPVLAQGFFSLLPVFNLRWVMDIATNALLLRDRKWQPVSRMLDIVLSVFDAVILVMLITGYPILRLQELQAMSSDLSISLPWINMGFTALLQFLLFVTAISIIKKIINWVKPATDLNALADFNSEAHNT